MNHLFPADDRHLMNEAELADYLSVSPRTVRRMRQARQIPFFKIRGAVRYDPSMVAEHLVVHGAPF
jgi:excisionase family DNA binding protein